MKKSLHTTFSPKKLELWKEALDKDMSVGAIFVDLSKAFDSLNHNVIAKLEAYGFSGNSLKLHSKLLTQSFTKYKCE